MSLSKDNQNGIGNEFENKLSLIGKVRIGSDYDGKQDSVL